MILVERTYRIKAAKRCVWLLPRVVLKPDPFCDN
jgi:hypothetical protein